jgi:hypothetical protein
MYPGDETNKPKQPLLSRQHSNKSDRVGSFVHGRFEGRETSRRVLHGAHLWRRSGFMASFADGFLVLGRMVCHIWLMCWNVNL